METRKLRTDTALTLEVALTVFERLETGLPLLKRGNNYLLLEGQEWANRVPVGTYNSWRTRNTIPIDSVDNKGFNELLTERRNKIAVERRNELLRLGERGISEILSMSIRQETTEKRINKHGEYERKTIERINPSIINAKLKVTIFALERLSVERYGKHANARKRVSTFSLADLRKVKHEVQ